MKRQPLTFAERKYLTAIEQLFVDAGSSPSIREIADRVGVSSTNAVAEVLDRLSAKGYLEREYATSRSIELRIGRVATCRRIGRNASKYRPSADVSRTRRLCEDLKHLITDERVEPDFLERIAGELVSEIALRASELRESE